jgi:hypothetical protein
MSDQFFTHDPTGAPPGASWGSTQPVSGDGGGVRQMHHGDGAPGGAADPTLGLGTPANAFRGARKTFTGWSATMARVRRVEGPRGTAIRVTVVLRWLAHVFAVILAAGIMHAAFAETSFHAMGTLMMFSAAVMAVTGALGTMFIPTKRPEIIEEFRHCLFHLCLAPAVALAAFSWVLDSYIGDARNGDQALSSIGHYLPMLCAFTVLAPAVVFVKMVSGRRHLDRSAADDAEMMATWTRQDRWVR